MAPLAIGAIGEVGKSKILQWTIVGVVVLAAIPLFFVGKKILEKFQIIDTPEERKAKKGMKSIESDDKLNPNYWKTLTTKERNELWERRFALGDISKTLRKQLQSYFIENEEAIIGAIRKIKSKAEFSFLSELYQKNTASDLMSDLKRSLYGAVDKLTPGDTESDIQTVIDIIKNLPNK